MDRKSSSSQPGRDRKFSQRQSGRGRKISSGQSGEDRRFSSDKPGRDREFSQRQSGRGRKSSSGQSGEGRRFSSDKPGRDRKFSQGKSSGDRRFSSGQSGEGRRFSSDKPGRDRKFSQGQSSGDRRFSSGQSGEGRKYSPGKSRDRASYPKTERRTHQSHFKQQERPLRKDVKVIRKNPSRSSSPSEIRLNRYIANAGICSRREADTYITAGVVTVNGIIVTELGTKVKLTDDVRFDGKKIEAERKVYLLLNKPKDYVTTTGDPYAEQTVMDLVKDACHERIYPVGRLDKSTTGLLLFTNDGELAERLTHPAHRVQKIYQVTLDKPLTKNDLSQIAEGVTLDDGPIAPDAISYIDNLNKNEIGIELHSGRNRIVRRIFEHLGYRVRKLDRVFLAGLTKKNLPRGKWRMLTSKEVQFLKMK